MKADIFEGIWNEVERVSDALVHDNVGAAIFNQNAKYILHDEYEKQIAFLKNNVLKNDIVHLDRHKTSAAMIIAIMNTNIIIVTPDVRALDPMLKFLFNEHLAITIGLSMLCMYIQQEVDARISNPKKIFLQTEYLQLLKDSLHRTIILPHESANKDPYLDCFKKHLYFNSKNNQLSVLSISHILFHIEVYHKHHVAAKMLVEKLYAATNEKDLAETDEFIHMLCDVPVHQNS